MSKRTIFELIAYFVVMITGSVSLIVVEHTDSLTGYTKLGVFNAIFASVTVLMVILLIAVCRDKD